MSEKTPTVIRIALPTNVYFLSGIRDFTYDTVHCVAGFTEQWAKRLQTVVDEIVNNAIEHGSIAGEMLEIEFQIEEQHAISVMVKNGPNGKSHMTAAELNAKLAEVKNEGEKPRIGVGWRCVSKYSIVLMSGKKNPWLVRRMCWFWKFNFLFLCLSPSLLSLSKLSNMLVVR